MRITRREFLIRAGAGVAGAAVFGCTSNLAQPKPKYADRLARLAKWVAAGFVGGEIGLLPNLPSGRIHSGRERPDLRNLYWLQNCNLYGQVALRPYDKTLAAKIEASYRRWYSTEFAGVEELTEHHLPLGRLPKVKVPPGMFLRNIVKIREYDGYRVGTETFEPGKVNPIHPDDPRTLLKCGVLRARLEGNDARAREYFEKAMKLWDKTGFPLPAGSRKDMSYRTRHLAFALIADRALGGVLGAATREAIERRLWACQDVDGGIWTNYNADGTFPGLSKKTTEIGPLTLLAFDPHAWPDA